MEMFAAQMDDKGVKKRIVLSHPYTDQYARFRETRRKREALR